MNLRTRIYQKLVFASAFLLIGGTAEVFAAKKVATPPKAPVLSATAEANGSVSLSWTSSGKGIRGYYVERSEAVNDNFNQTFSAGRKLNYSDSNSLKPKVIYYYRVRALKRKTFSTYSNLVMVEIKEAANQAPTANAGGPYQVVAGQALTLDGSGSQDPEGQIAQYSWDFGDGQNANVTTATVAHTYAQAGTYTAKLIVTDDKGAASQAAEATVTVTAANLPPVANAGGPYSAVAGQAVTLDGSGSTDADGMIIQYFWEFGDGNTSNQSVPTVSHTYAQAGTYTVKLTVRDELMAMDTAETTVTVGAANMPPIANPGGPYNAVVGQALTLDGSASSDPDGTIANYQWDFGDGNTGESAQATISHTYAAAGSFQVSLVVVDDKAQASSTTMTTVTVTEPPNNDPNPGLTAFQASVYVITRRDCASCHSESPLFPNHASADVNIAYAQAKPYANFTAPVDSALVFKVKDGHCGVACSTDGSEMTAAIAQWAAGESGGGDPNNNPGNSIAAIPIPSDIPTGVDFVTLTADLAGVNGLTDGRFMIDIQKFDDSHYMILNPRIESQTGSIAVKSVTVLINNNADLSISSYKDVNTRVPAGTTQGLLDGNAKGPAFPSIGTLGSDSIGFSFEAIGP